MPFYDRTHLFTKPSARWRKRCRPDAHHHHVVIMLVLNLRASLLISSLLPVAVLMIFIIMRYTGIDANIVALSGIAIAIGVMVDVGIICRRISSNTLMKHHPNKS